MLQKGLLLGITLYLKLTETSGISRLSGKTMLKMFTTYKGLWTRCVLAALAQKTLQSMRMAQETS
ncbi:hypothetical protein PS880_06231 [Pseudomonas fluorescens]|uniref:Uncharacterized protein n=1 Tax=Pseudomonas fluorescens TaxID=294 RepID=A0A5E7QHJ7_PSEFL|nr:hypothetical protein PS880_06231 [Pseudomonas fluorescens]